MRSIYKNGEYDYAPAGVADFRTARLDDSAASDEAAAE